MTYDLFLDDVREPETDLDWTVVRTVEAFKETIRDRGVPDHMSLDHDLGESYDNPEEAPNGMDAVDWMIDGGIVPPSYNVHSANGPAADRMTSKLDQWVKFNRGDLDDRF